MKVVVVDPVSSGKDLDQALRERGIEPFHVYSRFLEDAHASDPAPGGKLLHTSLETTGRVLKEYGAQAVVAGSETGVVPADELATALGLPHHVPRLAAARAGKLAEARALEAAGVPFARTEEVGDTAELPEVLGRFGGWPVVVKPVASAGSDGLAICTSATEVEEAVAGLLGRDNAVGGKNDTVLLQEYLDGPQYFLNTVSWGGRHAVSDLMTSRFDEVDGKPVLRHMTSVPGVDDDARAVVDYGLRCLDAVGLANGAGHTEIRLTARGPVLVEVNFRIIGPCVPADVYVPTLGHSQATLLADAVLGATDFPERAGRPLAPQPRVVGCVFLRAHDHGTVLGLPGLDAIRRLETFHSFAKLPGLGTRIHHPLLTTGSGGLAYFTGPTPEDVEADMARVHVLEDTERLYAMSGTVAE
ncbi:ATP-grasp domain-containing protein [Streptomyces sp. NPDC055186]